MSFPAPTWHDHEAFCRTEKWQEVRNARGETGLEDRDVAAMTKDEAVARKQRYWTEDR